MNVNGTDGEGRFDQQRQRMLLTGFLSLTGYVEGAWRLPTADPFCNTSIEYFRDIARASERAGLDAVFIADSLGLWADVRRRPTGTFEPSVLASMLLAATERLGVIITLSTSFNEPFNLARRLASLDLASQGRIGWNIVTSTSDETALNFGLDAIPDHDDRYARCEEFVEVCLDLWHSWDTGAIHGDKEGAWGDPDRIRSINHDGRHFKVQGPLDVPRSPQTVPLLVQAGSSNRGRDVAARFADVVFTVQDDQAAAAAFRSDVNTRARATGRTQRVRVLPGLIPIIGKDTADARDQLAYLRSLVDVERAVAEIERRFGLEVGSLDPDRPVGIDLPGPEDERGNRSIYDVLRRLAGDPEQTVADVARTMNTTRGHRTVLGDAQHIAGQMIAWVDSGAADGYNVIFPTIPDSFHRFLEEVVPELEARGYREGTIGPARTLRETFGAVPFDGGGVTR